MRRDGKTVFFAIGIICKRPMELKIRYAIDEQSFEKIRQMGALYIDKTEYVYNMTHESTYVFLSRPRRFGKSLLLRTLQSYFEGRRDLFEGLAIDRLETEWTVYPVLRFDMSRLRGLDTGMIPASLGAQLSGFEETYGENPKEQSLGDRLRGIIKRAYEQTGRKVVVLVDEYDTPLLDSVHEPDNLAEVRKVMTNFYSSFKDCTEYLRFVFLTGITKFSQMTLFSGVNNFNIITMDEKYAAVCGITKTELREQMWEDVKMLAAKMLLTPEQTEERLIDNYDGYHFTWPSEDIINPLSLLTAFSKKKIVDKWFETATPTYVINMLRKYNVHPSDVGREEVREERFNAPVETAGDYIPLLYQSGYLTIKGYDEESRRYMIDIPNMEVRNGLMDELGKYYLPQDRDTDDTIDLIRESLAANDMDSALRAIQDLLPQIPYTRDIDYEGHYQQIIFLLFFQAGAEVDAEKRTANGRIDMLIRTKTRLYVMELKMDRSAAVAMSQIRRKRYERMFAKCKTPIVRVGVNIDSKARTLKDWTIS